LVLGKLPQGARTQNGEMSRNRLDNRTVIGVVADLPGWVEISATPTIRPGDVAVAQRE
jgi:hypothetical protein